MLCVSNRNVYLCCLFNIDKNYGTIAGENKIKWRNMLWRGGERMNNRKRVVKTKNSRDAIFVATS